MEDAVACVGVRLIGEVPVEILHRFGFVKLLKNRDVDIPVSHMPSIAGQRDEVLPRILGSCDKVDGECIDIVRSGGLGGPRRSGPPKKPLELLYELDGPIDLVLRDLMTSKIASENAFVDRGRILSWVDGSP